MQTEIIIAGFGGQGVLFAGQLLAYAAMDQGLEVTWIPSYGPEMRGGTANCTVIISTDEIGSPIERHPQALIAMNRPSLDKYENQVDANGVLLVDSTMVNRTPQRTDLKTLIVPANEIAEKFGNKRMANMVMVGALLTNMPVLKIEALEQSLREHLPSRHQHLLAPNSQALREGAKFIYKPPT